MASQNRYFPSTLQTLVFATILLCLCEGFSMPLSWGRSDMPNCLGMVGNRDLYENLSRICSDCQNVFRNNKNIDSKCRSECFNSSYFETCIMALQLAEKLNEYKIHASILKGGRK